MVTVGRIDEKKEGIIDMSGPGATYTPFSKTHNLVLECQPVSGLDYHQFDEALRLAGLKTAHYIGEKCRDATLMKRLFTKPFHWKNKNNSTRNCRR